MNCSQCKYFQYEIRKPSGFDFVPRLFYYCNRRHQPLASIIRDAPCDQYKKKRRGSTKVIFNHRDIFYTKDKIKINLRNNDTIDMEIYYLHNTCLTDYTRDAYYGDIISIERIKKGD